MAINFNPVVFTDGEPFDANKLNILQQNLTAVYGEAAALVNATKNSQDQSTVVVMESGQYEFSNGTGSKQNATSAPIPFTAAFSGNPTFIVSPSRDSYGVYTTAAGYVSNGQGYININTSAPTDGSIKINWIAVQNKVIG